MSLMCCCRTGPALPKGQDVSPHNLALLGGQPVGSPTPPRHPQITEEARKRVDDLLRNGPMVGLSDEHPDVGEAERTVAAWHGVPHCLTTSTGHASLHACLIGLEITDGAHVITTPYTYGGSTSPILSNNAVPIYADVDPIDGLLDPVSVEAAISPKVEAILVTHIYGQPADMTALRRIADKHGLALIEDGSQAHGARHRGRPVGSFGDAAGFSCMGGKLLGTTEAGYMVTPRADVYWNAVISTQHAGGTEVPGRSSQPDFPPELAPFIDSLITTYRVSVVNAVLMAEQLKKLDSEVDGRIRNRNRLVEMLKPLRTVTAPEFSGGDKAVHHLLSLNFVPEEAGISKQTYIAALRAEGAPVFAYVAQPLHKLERLRPTTKAPRALWMRTLAESGIDYSNLDLPGCDYKVARSIEMTWNWMHDDEAAMRRYADCFHKVEEALPELRDYEASNRGTSTEIATDGGRR